MSSCSEYRKCSVIWSSLIPTLLFRLPPFSVLKPSLIQLGKSDIILEEIRISNDLYCKKPNVEAHVIGFLSITLIKNSVYPNSVSCWTIQCLCPIFQLLSLHGCCPHPLCLPDTVSECVWVGGSGTSCNWIFLLGLYWRGEKGGEGRDQFITEEENDCGGEIRRELAWWWESRIEKFWHQHLNSITFF